MRWRRYFVRGRRDEDLSQEIADYVAQETGRQHRAAA